MLTVMKALKKVNKWSGWERGCLVLPLSHSGDGLLTGSGVWGEFVVSPQHYFSSAHRSPCKACSLVMWGLLWMGSLEPCFFYLKPPGSRQQRLLHGAIYIPARLDFVSSQWLHLLLDDSTAPARRVTSLTLLKLSYQTIFFSESRTFFLCFMLQL